jgi:hypothetical protein
VAVIAQSQKTLVDLNDPVQQGTVPDSPVTGLLWLDTSQSPPILKRYTGAEWEVVGDIEIGGRNLLPDTSDEYTDVVIGQYFAALGGYFDTRDYGIKAGDKLMFSFYVKVPDTAARGVRARITAYVEDKSSYVATNGANVIQPGAEGYCVLLYTVNGAYPLLRPCAQNANISITDAMTVQVRLCKLERGTKRTDWTPALEDTEEQLALKLAEAHAQINTTANSIRQEVQANYAAASDMTQVRQQLTTLSEQTENNFTWAVTRISEISEDAENNLARTDEKLTQIETYMTFAEDGLIVGKTGNPVTLRILNDRVAFYMNNAEVAYLSNNKLYVTQAEVLGRLQIGQFAYEPQSNGNLSIIYTG